MQEASATIKAMRDFFDAPFLRGMQMLQDRKENHLAAVEAMEKAVVMGSKAAVDDFTAELKNKIAFLDRDLSAFSSADSDHVKTVAEYVNAIHELETTNADQAQAIKIRDSEIETLRTEMAQQEQVNSGLNSSITVLQAQYDDLQRRMEAAIKAFSGE